MRRFFLLRDPRLLRRALVCLVPLALALTGCAENAFSVAKKQDTVGAYRSFLRDYPKDDNAEAATSRLADLEFEHAQSLHTVLGYKRFLEEFPETRHTLTARALLESLRFEAAKAQNTALALRLFLHEHPDGAHHAEGEKLLSEADLRELARIDDPKTLAQQAASAPPGPVRDAAQARFDDAAYAEAKTLGAQKLYAYLRDFPAGAHREQVKRELLSLQLEGLLFSGLVEQARALADRSPLSAGLTDLPARFARAEQDRAAQRAREPLAQAALVENYLRTTADLERGLSVPDALERWQAAEELGQVVSIEALDPLLRAFRDGRNPLVRERAFQSLVQIVHALPHAVADYELATRLETLRAVDASAETARVGAVLLDLSGRLSLAAAEYQKAYDPASPDPAILWRFAHLREERREAFSAGVAARQLAVWARGVAEATVPDPSQPVPLGVARDLCAAAINAREAEAILLRLGGAKTEFPEDMAEFTRDTVQARKLVEARLADVELLVRTQDPRVVACGDARVSDRIAAGLADRRHALEQLPAKLPKLAPVLLRVAGAKDPSPEVRQRAQALLAGADPTLR